MPIDDVVHHVGIEDLYLTQPMPSLTPEQGELEQTDADARRLIATT
jgi:hypothetical protein